jgi:outer membrane protein assembly factor BamA
MIVALTVTATACAPIPKGRYGVKRLNFEGVEALDQRALRACLATRERDRVELGLGVLGSPSCGKPPFDRSRATWGLWSWGWTDWPVYDEGVLKLDLARIERWYAARGYYDAHVLKLKFDPPDANDAQGDEPCEDGCRLRISVFVEEGKPVRIRKIALQGTEGLTPELKEKVEDALSLEEGSIFDEAMFEQARGELADVLREPGFARAEVRGDAAVHRGLLYADLKLELVPGPLCKVGKVRIEGSGVPHAPILAAAMITEGRTFRESDLDDAQRAVYALGAFSAVSVRGDLEGDGAVIPIVIEVQARRDSEVLLGAGLMSGVLTSGPAADEWVSVPQWDVHLFGSFEHRNFLGGLRRLRVEERPRLLFLQSFPDVPENSPRFGNTLSVNFTQPGVFDPRTSLFVESRWDYGPDPFLLFFRHDFGVATGLDRGFFKQRLQARLAIHQEIMQVGRRQPIVEDAPSSYRLPFLEQRVSLDLRDDAANPTKGAYFRVGVHEALKFWEPSWNYLRLTPEARGYAPLGLGMVVAARFAVGMLYVFEASPELDPEARKLGPQAYRLRGGGSTSNRGFGPGELGDGLNGGIRRWEASLELRVPLFKDFSVVAFSDLGDVHAAASFRFNHLNGAIGGGMRYRTIVGPIRFDVGYRPPWYQRADGSTPEGQPRTDLGFTKFNGAVHLTIGESF